jgi:hypothetical protein
MTDAPIPFKTGPVGIPTANLADQEYKAAVLELQSRLAILAGQVKDGGNPVTALRMKWCLGAVGVSSFLNKIGAPPEIEDIFLELGEALYDLHHGTQSPALSKPSIDRRPPDPTRIWILRAKVSVQLERLISGEGPEGVTITAIEIAKKFPKLARLLHNPSNTLSTSILGWRTTFRDKACANVPAQEIFDEEFELVASDRQRLSPAEMAAAAMAALGSLEKRSSAVLRS